MLTTLPSELVCEIYKHLVAGEALSHASRDTTAFMDVFPELTSCIIRSPSYQEFQDNEHFCRLLEDDTSNDTLNDTLNDTSNDTSNDTIPECVRLTFTRVDGSRLTEIYMFWKHDEHIRQPLLSLEYGLYWTNPALNKRQVVKVLCKRLLWLYLQQPEPVGVVPFIDIEDMKDVLKECGWKMVAVDNPVMYMMVPKVTLLQRFIRQQCLNTGNWSLSFLETMVVNSKLSHALIWYSYFMRREGKWKEDGVSFCINVSDWVDMELEFKGNIYRRRRKLT